MLEERRRLGHDRFDEVWEGVLHMVPPPPTVHKRVESNLQDVLKRIVAPRGFEVFHDPGLYDPAVPGQASYRVPDLAVVASEHLTMRGIEGLAELVVEIISPNDESRDKLPFYARVGVREVWLLDPARKSIEVFNGMTAVVSDARGRITAPSLRLVLAIEGTTLKIKDGAEMHAVDIRDSL